MNQIAVRNGIALGTLLAASACLWWISGARAQPLKPEARPEVIVARVPDGGLQPQVAVKDGVVHLLYYKGDPKSGDLFYVASKDDGVTWSRPLRVNSQAGSAIAMGTIRGGTLALGRDGRVCVVWNGSGQAAPLLFARLNDDGSAFEAQRNLLGQTLDLDGGAAIAADGEGHVYVAWHAIDRAGQDESKRQMWLATSSDDGRIFGEEKKVWNNPTGACGCCQVAVQAGGQGSVAILYRSATENVHRDTYLLRSSDYGVSFKGRKISEWPINACPMSTYAMTGEPGAPTIGWETAGQVFWTKVTKDGQVGDPIAAPGEGQNRKYPALAQNASGQTLFAWTQGTSWGRGGNVKFQLFDNNDEPIGIPAGRDDLPAWSFATAFLRPDGKFEVIY